MLHHTHMLLGLCLLKAGFQAMHLRGWDGLPQPTWFESDRSWVDESQITEHLVINQDGDGASQ
jgi:hypothetical protein